MVVKFCSNECNYHLVTGQSPPPDNHPDACILLRSFHQSSLDYLSNVLFINPVNK